MIMATTTTTPTKSKPSEYLTRRETADYIHVETCTLAAWAFRKKGPKFYRIGGAVRYKLSDVQDFINKGMVATSDQK
jgi:hypothetical protein